MGRRFRTILAYMASHCTVVLALGDTPLRDERLIYQPEAKVEVAPPPDHVINRVSAGLILLERIDAQGGHKGTANAFLIDGSRVVTNRHCLLGATSARVNLGVHGIFKVVSLVAEDRVHDLVVLKTDIPAGLVEPLTLAATVPPKRTPIAILTRNVYGELSTSPGQSGRTTLDHGFSGESLLTTAPAWLGCSGSPVVNHEGVVVGIVNLLIPAGKGEQATASTAPIAKLHALLASPGEIKLEDWALAVADAAAAEDLRRTGDRYMDDRDYEKALAAFRAGLARDPTAVTCVYRVASCLRQLDRDAEIESTLDEFLAINPLVPHIWFYRGQVHHREKEFDEAVACYGRSIDLRPSAESWYWVGAVRMLQGRRSDALRAFEQAVLLEPDHPYAGPRLIDLYQSMQRFDDAARVARGRADSDPLNVPELASLAYSLKRAANTTEYHKRLDRLRALSPFAANRVEHDLVKPHLDDLE